MLVAAALVIGTPFFVFFGRLSDRIGRKPIMVAGCLLAALTYVPIFKGLSHYAEPGIGRFPGARGVTVAAKECQFQYFRQAHDAV